MKNLLHYVILTVITLFIASSCQNGDMSLSVEKIGNTEDSIRNALHIPNDAEHVVILSHAAHMDWDWLNKFIYNANQTPPQYTSYFSCGERCMADSILGFATQNLQDTSYYYSICEMGFLQIFANDRPAEFSQMKNSGNLRIVGGGITSPDNLLPSGEGFIRNFLIANNWLNEVGVPWSGQVWIPDDFGHDPQLPVMLEAMDAIGVGFARIPGACDGQSQLFSAPQTILLDTVNGGVDFLWTASDSSQAIAHWLSSHYNQGEDLESNGGADYNSPEDNLNCDKSANPTTVTGHIQAYINTNKPVSPTPYIYVHVSDDFMRPYQQLVKDVNTWNSDPNGYAATGVYAVVATFDHYVRLVETHKSSLKSRSYQANSPSGVTDLFQPNPYWMGYYGSRPELKTLHNDAVRSLVGTEIFQIINNSLIPVTFPELSGQTAQIMAGWDSLAPSTHHDYITGTAIDDVYLHEQLPLLNYALNTGDSMRNMFMTGIANSVSPNPGGVVVCNQLGFDNQSIIEYTPTGGTTTYLNAQAPSLGYKVVDFSAVTTGNGTLKAENEGSGNIVLSNSQLAAYIDQNTGDLISVFDKVSNNQVLSGIGNEIVFFNDGGGIYRFGYESSGCDFDSVSITWSNYSVSYDTANALQKSISVTKQVYIGGSTKDFTVTYSLRQDEPYLRMSTIGSLPYYYTAMVRFPLTANVDNLMAGTPYHWNSMENTVYGSNPDFNATMWATHDFVIPRADSNNLAAIYHGSTPAWAAQGNKLYGVILRNTPGSCPDHGYGADGSDVGTHTQEYALRIPSGLELPNTGQPLKEARQYHTPMIALPVSTSATGIVPDSFSLASTTDNALITAAKWGYVDSFAVILRVYQPSNSRVATTLTINRNISGCQAVSAMESNIVNASVRPSCSLSGSDYTLNLPRAVATFKLK